MPPVLRSRRFEILARGRRRKAARGISLGLDIELPGPLRAADAPGD